VATGADLQARVQAEGFTAAVAGPTAIEAAVGAMSDPAVQAAGAEERWRFPATMFAGILAPRKLPELRELAGSFRPDLIVHPPVDLAGPLLATERGVPSACYGFLRPPEDALIAGFAEQVGPLWAQAGLSPDPHAGIYRGWYLDRCPAGFGSRTAAAAGRSGPLRATIPGDPDAMLPGWVDRLGRRPTVYVSLGTVPLFNQPARLKGLLEQLLGEDLELVVTVSELHDPAALGELPPTVHVERWLSLAALLPRCDAVLCHAGSGTTLAALAAGLPLVPVPDGADQFTNAQACAAAGVARTLLPADVTPGAVRDAVLGVLARDGVERAAARRVAAEIAEMPSPADVAAELAAWVASSRGSARVAPRPS
jgi:hypothetical protein